MRKLLFFNILVLSLVSCQTQETTANEGSSGQSKIAEKAFFDVKGFFTGEIKRLTEMGMTIKKTVTVNGKSESQTLEKPNFEDEFKMFIASDINRPAWTDKYTIEKKQLNNQSTVTEYTSKDENLKTQKMAISEMNGPVYQTIEIHNSDKSLATQAETHLFYDKQNGYSMSTFQKLVGSVDSVKIEVSFLKN